jgi:hypothetical protein
MVFAYFGPETVLPATSAIAAAAGFLLMFGKQAGRFAALMVRRIISRRRGSRVMESAIPSPHLPGFPGARRVKVSRAESHVR